MKTEKIKWVSVSEGRKRRGGCLKLQSEHAFIYRGSDGQILMHGVRSTSNHDDAKVQQLQSYEGFEKAMDENPSNAKNYETVPYPNQRHILSLC